MFHLRLAHASFYSVGSLITAYTFRPISIQLRYGIVLATLPVHLKSNKAPVFASIDIIFSHGGLLQYTPENVDGFEKICFGWKKVIRHGGSSGDSSSSQGCEFCFCSLRWRT